MAENPTVDRALHGAGTSGGPSTSTTVELPSSSGCSSFWPTVDGSKIENRDRHRLLDRSLEHEEHASLALRWMSDKAARLPLDSAAREERVRSEVCRPDLEQLHPFQLMAQ